MAARASDVAFVASGVAEYVRLKACSLSASLRYSAFVPWHSICLPSPANTIMGFSMTARHRRNGPTTFDLRYENQTDRFPLSPVRGTDCFRVMPGVELRLRALLNGSAWVGYRRFEPKAAVLPSQAGLISQLALF